MMKEASPFVTAVVFVAGLAVLEADHRAAEAQVITHDPMSLVNDVKEFVQQTSWHSQDMAQGAELIGRAETQVRQGVRMYDAATKVDSIQELLSFTGQFGLKTPLPRDAMTLANTLQGDGGWQNLLPGMRGMFRTLSQRNAVYSPPDKGNWVGQALVRAVNSATASQAASLSIHEEIERRQEPLEELRERLKENLTPAERDTVRGEIATEQAQIDRLQAGLNTVVVFSQSQRQVEALEPQLQTIRATDEVLRDACVRARVGC